MQKDIEELSLEHYLSLHPKDATLPKDKLKAEYDKWVNDYIEELTADQYIDVWKTSPPYEL